MEDGERLIWSFVTIAVFAIVLLLFHRRRATRMGAFLPILLSIALTIGVALVLLDPFGAPTAN